MDKDEDAGIGKALGVRIGRQISIGIMPDRGDVGALVPERHKACRSPFTVTSPRFSHTRWSNIDTQVRSALQLFNSQAFRAALTSAANAAGS